MWFVEQNSDKIAIISPVTGTITEYAVPTTGAGLLGIAAGPDGNLWFTEQTADKIGKISPSSGTVTEYDVPVTNAAPNENRGRTGREPVVHPKPCQPNRQNLPCDRQDYGI